jgi:hypothetical protein
VYLVYVLANTIALVLGLLQLTLGSVTAWGQDSPEVPMLPLYIGS